MSEYVFKLPDLGEGTVEAEIVEWHVTVGDVVKEGDVIVDVMTDKANVEVPAPVDGTVLRTSGEPGDIVAVGSELIALEAAEATGRRAGRRAAPAQPAPAPVVDDRKAADEGAEQAQSGAGDAARPERAPAAPAQRKPEKPEAEPEPTPMERGATGKTGGKPAPGAVVDDAASADLPRRRGERVITSPAIRRRAKEAGIDLHNVAGSGPRGRVLRRDLDAAIERGSASAGSGSSGAAPAPAGAAADGPKDADQAEAAEFEEAKVIGVRRVIAERMSQSKREIPHFAYVEEVDVSELESLRRHLNDTHQRRLTVLPFIALALIRALRVFPQCNARFDAERGMLQRFRPVHLGIATQTPDGLKVPVVRGAEHRTLWNLAAEIARVAEAAREGSAGREELSGSTITITSLGRMGGIVTTPVINYPEVGIIGINKAIDRPVVINGQVTVRTMMNLSSSFDHRFVDGFDAAAMIQQVKASLEHPADLFIPAPESEA